MADAKVEKIVLDGQIYLAAPMYKGDKETRFRFSDGPVSEYLVGEGWIPSAPYTIEIEFPKGLDLYKAKLETLQKKRKVILLNNKRQLNAIDQEISEHLSIEHKEQS